MSGQWSSLVTGKSTTPGAAGGAGGKKSYFTTEKKKPWLATERKKSWFSSNTGTAAGREMSDKKYSNRDVGKTRIASVVNFKKHVLKSKLRKDIGRKTVRVNNQDMHIDELRDKLIDVVGRAGSRGISGEQLEKKLRDEYKMDIKTRKKVVRAIARHWAKPDNGEMEAKQRDKIRRINVSLYRSERSREEGDTTGAIRSHKTQTMSDKTNEKAVGVAGDHKGDYTALGKKQGKEGFALSGKAAGLSGSTEVKTEGSAVTVDDSAQTASNSAGSPQESGGSDGSKEDGKQSARGRYTPVELNSGAAYSQKRPAEKQSIPENISALAPASNVAHTKIGPTGEKDERELSQEEPRQSNDEGGGESELGQEPPSKTSVDEKQIPPGISALAPSSNNAHAKIGPINTGGSELSPGESTQNDDNLGEDNEDNNDDTNVINEIINKKNSGFKQVSPYKIIREGQADDYDDQYRKAA